MKLQKRLPIEPRKRSITELLEAMSHTAYQGRNLGDVFLTWKKMLKDPNLTILFGYAGSLSTGGQWKSITWLIQHNYIDILVPTGANVSEDIIEAMGFSYHQLKEYASDSDLFIEGYNRYLDHVGDESDYLKMTELIAEFMLTCNEKRRYTSAEFLHEFGLWLAEKNIWSIVAHASKQNIPVFCPAIGDSPYGDASLISFAKGHDIDISSTFSYKQYMALASHVKDTGVIYIGGGVPKDYIQLFSVTADLLYPDRKVPNRGMGLNRKNTGPQESYHPHKYAIQLTTDAPQWGGLSGCTFEEATSWGKELEDGNNAVCYVDATIGLPILIQGLLELQTKGAIPKRRKKRALYKKITRK